MGWLSCDLSGRLAHPAGGHQQGQSSPGGDALDWHHADLLGVSPGLSDLALLATVKEKQPAPHWQDAVHGQTLVAIGWSLYPDAGHSIRLDHPDQHPRPEQSCQPNGAQHADPTAALLELGLRDSVGPIRRRNDFPRHLFKLLLPRKLPGDELPWRLHVWSDFWHDARHEFLVHAPDVLGLGLGARLHVPEVPRLALQRNVAFLE